MIRVNEPVKIFSPGMPIETRVYLADGTELSRITSILWELKDPNTPATVVIGFVSPQACELHGDAVISFDTLVAHAAHHGYELSPTSRLNRAGIKPL